MHVRILQTVRLLRIGGFGTRISGEIHSYRVSDLVCRECIITL